MKRTQKKWTEPEIEFLKENLNLMNFRKLADELSTTRQMVIYKSRKLGLKRDPETARKFHLEKCFKKGHIPWTMGMKGYHFSPETEFKKGNLPVNTKYDGCIVERTDTHGITYKYIRIAMSKWETYHRFIWEKHNGPVPPKHIIGFRNGITTDCRIENLYCMSKADNAKRNHNYLKAAATMRLVWASGKFYNSDNYIAHLLSVKNRQIRDEIKKQPELINLKRMQLKLRRAIRESR